MNFQHFRGVVFVHFKWAIMKQRSGIELELPAEKGEQKLGVAGTPRVAVF